MTRMMFGASFFNHVGKGFSGHDVGDADASMDWISSLVTCSNVVSVTDWRGWTSGSGAVAVELCGFLQPRF